MPKLWLGGGISGLAREDDQNTGGPCPRMGTGRLLHGLRELGAGLSTPARWFVVFGRRYFGAYPGWLRVPFREVNQIND